MLAPLMVDNFSRTSFITASRLRSFKTNGASISDTFTPKACSSSSARPVLRATVWISGTCISNSSARRPISSDSSREMPGRELTLIVNEPSLNGGRKLRPSVKNIPNATRNRPIVHPNTIFLCANAPFKALPYNSFNLRATHASFSTFLSVGFRFNR